jgi:very-short-patch-repair endonuclease
VVSSFHPAELSPQKLQAAKHGGTELLRLYLEYADDPSRLDRGPTGGSASLNGFEHSILAALQEVGLPVWPQWGVAGYRIDFAIAHPKRPGEMVLAVETDGERYHTTRSARDRDRLRQEQLERLGWRFHRLWSADWLRDPEGETERIRRAWQQAVQDADNGTAGPANKPVAASAAQPDRPRINGHDRGPRPSVPRYPKIGDYSNDQLTEVCLWLLRDRRQLPRDERIRQAMTEFGFQKRGSIIVDRLGRACDQAQMIFDHEDGH